MSEPLSSNSRPSRYNPWPLLRILFLAALSLGLVGYGIYAFQIARPLQANINQANTLYENMTGLSRPIVNRLQDRFGPPNADLTASAPTDSSKLIDPSPLIFSYVIAQKPEKYRDGFQECCDSLSQKLGRPVKYQIFNSTDEMLSAMRDGKLQIAAFSTGTVPIAVDAAGFVPVCSLGGEIGPQGERKGDYCVKILVKPDCPIQSLDDLKGHELGLSDPQSNSGFKAPLVLLSRDHGLLPGRDFSIRYSGNQQTSIDWLAKGTVDVIAVASDVLDSSIADGKINPNQFRVIYTSSPFPPACFGYVYNLKPELAAQIKSTLLGFQWKGTGLEKLFAVTGQDRFVPISYKNDWALVRQIDDAIGAAHVLK